MSSSVMYLRGTHKKLQRLHRPQEPDFPLVMLSEKTRASLQKSANRCSAIAARCTEEQAHIDEVIGDIRNYHDGGDFGLKHHLSKVRQALESSKTFNTRRAAEHHTQAGIYEQQRDAETEALATRDKRKREENTTFFGDGPIIGQTLVGKEEDSEGAPAFFEITKVTKSSQGGATLDLRPTKRVMFEVVSPSASQWSQFTPTRASKPGAIDLSRPPVTIKVLPCEREVDGKNLGIVDGQNFARSIWTTGKTVFFPNEDTDKAYLDLSQPPTHPVVE